MAASGKKHSHQHAQYSAPFRDYSKDFMLAHRLTLANLAKGAAIIGIAEIVALRWPADAN
jgi:hypothetical protein